MPAPDFVLEDDQNVDCEVQGIDDAGNIVTGVEADAGTVTAEVSDPTILEATVSADQSSVNIKALGPIATGTTVTVNGSVNGAALIAGTLAVDVVDSAVTTIGIIPGTPVHN